MKTLKYALPVLIGIMLLSTSCSKDDPKTRKEIILSHSWKLISQTFNGLDDPLEECDKDDYYTFNENGSFQVFKGTNHCIVGETTDTFLWTLSIDENSLTLNGIFYTIIEMSESKAVLKFEHPSVGTGIFTYVPY